MLEVVLLLLVVLVIGFTGTTGVGTIVGLIVGFMVCVLLFLLVFTCPPLLLLFEVALLIFELLLV